MRKSPYEHPVTGHYREGKYIDRYRRGSGKKPVDRSLRGMGRAMPESGFKVTVYYPEGSESSSVKAGTFTEAVMQGTGEAEEMPKRVRVRRLNK